MDSTLDQEIRQRGYDYKSRFRLTNDLFDRILKAYHPDLWTMKKNNLKETCMLYLGEDKLGGIPRDEFPIEDEIASNNTIRRIGLKHLAIRLFPLNPKEFYTLLNRLGIYGEDRKEVLFYLSIDVQINI